MYTYFSSPLKGRQGSPLRIERGRAKVVSHRHFLYHHHSRAIRRLAGEFPLVRSGAVAEAGVDEELQGLQQMPLVRHDSNRELMNKLIRDLDLLPQLLGQDWSSVFLQRFDGTVT